MSTALLSLRRHILAGNRVERDGQDLVVGNEKIPISTPADLSLRSGKAYSVGDVWFLLQNKDATFGEYISACTSSGMQTVAIQDKKPLIDYLTLESASIPQLIQLPRSLSTAEETDRDLKRPRTGDAVENDPNLQESRDKFAALLDNKTSSRVSTTTAEAEARDLDQIKALAPSLDAERIKALKDKRKLQKRTSVVGDVTIAPDHLRDITLKSFVAADAEATAQILANEQPLATRLTVLRCNKDFNDCVDLVRSRKKQRRDKEAKQKEEQMRRESSYDRYNVKEDEFWKQRLNDAHALQIDTRGTFDMKMNLGGAHAKAARDNEEVDVSTDHEPKPRSTSSKPPIIIVPSAITAPINLYNAQSFLQDSSWRDPLEVRQEGKKPSSALVAHTCSGGRRMRFMVVDAPKQLSKGDWDRVIAIFCTGQEWQFKTGYPWTTPAEVLGRYRGFHLSFREDKAVPNIANWRVKNLQISRGHRHYDRAAAIEFWKELEAWMTQRKKESRKT